MKLEFKEYRGIKPASSGEDYSEYIPEYARKLGYDPNEVTANGWNWAFSSYGRMMFNIQRGTDAGAFCRECGDTRLLPVLTWDKDLQSWHIAARHCSCSNRLSVIKNTQDSGISRELETKNFGTFKRDTAFRESLYQHARNYLMAIRENKKAWFYIGGQTGAGKTHICTAIANRFLQNNYRLKYMRWTDESYKSAGERNNLQQYKEAQVLYIDDLFKTKPSEYMIGMAFELINFRDNNNLITIISSELPANALRETDSAIYGRIRMHTGSEFMISINTDDEKNYREQE